MVIITKENKNNYAAGTFLVVGLDNQPILKNNGKPWSGKTNSISNYYGIIVGAGKYAAVKSGVVWNPDYRIMFTPEVQEDITPVIVDQIVEAGENTVIPEEHSEVIRDMEQIDINFKYNN